MTKVQIKPRAPPHKEGKKRRGKTKQSAIKVAVRVRPLIKRELKKKDKQCTAVLDEHQIGIYKNWKHAQDPPHGTLPGCNQFKYDCVFGPAATQQEVYGHYAAFIVEEVVKGYHGCIFCYGQTGSGKTFTMYGDCPDNEGIVFNVARDLAKFSTDCKGREVTVTASYLEIYNEKVKDLLVPSSKKSRKRRNSGSVLGLNESLRIREDPTKGVYVVGLTARPLEALEDYQELLAEGNSRRTTADTKMNDKSSRSHSVLTLSIEQASEGVSLIESKLALVDLAGSERQSSTGAVGDTLKEGAMINQSLTNLGRVISALVDKQKYVPYRNSALTRLLQNSLGGNSQTLMIANVSPSTDAYAESLSTLRFANRAKQIKNKAVINIDPTAALIRELRAEIDWLRSLLAECTCGKRQLMETNTPFTRTTEENELMEDDDDDDDDGDEKGSGGVAVDVVDADQGALMIHQSSSSPSSSQDGKSKRGDCQHDAPYCVCCGTQCDSCNIM